MNLRKYFLTKMLIVTLFLSLNIMAETIVKGSQTQAPLESNEVILLKAQITSMENHQSQLISIVLWSLSSVIAMALGLAAFNWYTSKVSYEREIHAISQESTAKYKDLHSEIRSSINEQSQILRSELGSKEEEIKNFVIEKLQKKFNAQTAMIDGNRLKIIDLQYNLVELLAENAMKEGRATWAIYQYCDLLEISVKQKSDDYRVTEILDHISKALDTPNICISSNDITKTTNVFKKLPEAYHPAAQKVLDKLMVKEHG